MRNAVNHLEAAISEVEERVKQGHISQADADETIQKLRDMYERLTRLSEALSAYKPE